MSKEKIKEQNEKKIIEEPIPIKRTQIEPFPLEVLPKWLSDYVVGISKELNTMVDLPVSAALSALSAALTGKLLFVHNNWILNVNLYQVLAALPSSKKDAVIKRGMSALYQIRKKSYDEHKIETKILQSKIDSLTQSYESIKVKISKTSEQEKIKELESELGKLNFEIAEIKMKQVMRWFIISGDITPERLVEVLSNNNGMVTIATAEASELFDHVNGRYNNTSIDLLLKAWEGSEYTAFRSTKEDEIIPEPLLNLCLFTQPLVFDALRKHEHRGLPQRFLMIYPDRYPLEKHELFYTFDAKIENKYKESITALFNLNLEKPWKVTVEKEAKGKFEELYKEIIEKSYNDDFPETVQEWEGKIFGNLLKVISLLLVAKKLETNKNLKENPDLKLTVTDIENMKKLYNYYSSHFKKSYKLIKSGLKEDNLLYFFKRILELFETHSTNRTLSSTVLNNHIPKFNSSERMKMLKELENFNLIEITHKGRSINIKLNPKIEKMPPKEVLQKYLEAPK